MIDTMTQMSSVDPLSEKKLPAEVPDERTCIVKLSERLISPHPIVAKVKGTISQSQRRATEHSQWQIDVNELTVSVSKNQKDRALRILDGIYKAWELLGYETRISDGALLDGEDAVTFSLTEVFRRIDDRSSGPRWENWKYIETGNLAIEMTSRHGDGLRRKWCDRKTQKIEAVLDSFIMTIPKYMAFLRQERLDKECEKRQELKAKTRLAAFQNEAQRQEQLIKELEQTAADWSQAKLIREYLAALENRKNSGVVEPVNPAAFGEWLEWAKWYADELCPLTFSRPKPGQQAEPENTMLTELDVTHKTKALLEALTIADTDELFRLTRKEIKQLLPNHHWGFCRELANVLVGLGYDMTDKDWNNYGW